MPVTAANNYAGADAPRFASAGFNKMLHSSPVGAAGIHRKAAPTAR